MWALEFTLACPPIGLDRRFGIREYFSRSRGSNVKQTNSSPGVGGNGGIPPRQSVEFIPRMEDVLDVYHSDYDPDCPVICFDESRKQLVPLAMRQNLC